jgi:hypothetical protein
MSISSVNRDSHVVMGIVPSGGFKMEIFYMWMWGWDFRRNTFPRESLGMKTKFYPALS